MGRHKKIPERIYSFIDYDDFIEKDGGRMVFRARCPKCGCDRGYKRPNKFNSVCRICAVEHMRTYIMEESRKKQSKIMKGCTPWNQGLKMPQYIVDAMIAGHDRAKGTTQSERLLRQKMHGKIHTLIIQKIKRRLINKTDSFLKYLPYNIDDLISHLESKFQEGMSWDNHGAYDANIPRWQIDHICPDSWFEYNSMDDQGFKDSWALSNLQPMWAKDNIIKNNRYEG